MWQIWRQNGRAAESRRGIDFWNRGGDRHQRPHGVSMAQPGAHNCAASVLRAPHSERGDHREWNPDSGKHSRRRGFCYSVGPAKSKNQGSLSRAVQEKKRLGAIIDLINPRRRFFLG